MPTSIQSGSGWWFRMQRQAAFITCAVTGGADTARKSSYVPVTPTEIANAAIEAARAGAAVVHIHVRDPETGLRTRSPALFAEVVDRIRASDVDVVINLTVGGGGDLSLGSVEAPLPFAQRGTDLAGVTERLAHVAALRPEICTLDCGSMNFGEGNYAMINTPDTLRALATAIRRMGVKPELEIFDTGNLWFAKKLKSEGLIEEPMLLQLCMGIPYGVPSDLGSFVNLTAAIPSDSVFSAFGIGQMQLPFVALSALSGGNVRVGLEDNLYLRKGVKASNGMLVERAVTILQSLNVDILGPKDVRKLLGLRKAAPLPR